MLNETREKFEKFVAQVGTLNGVPNATTKFAVTPAIQQRLETRIQESSDYLGMINVTSVVAQSGDKVGVGVDGPIASRTDTTQNDRSPRDPTALDEHGYTCTQTNSDTGIPYNRLDAWAEFPDFQNRIRDSIIRRQGLDRLLVGWQGIKIAKQTDFKANPLLQDVNKGWLQHLREDAPENVMTAGKNAGEIRVGPGGDYENLDALVFDMVTMLDPWHQEDTGLRVHLGRKLLNDKLFPIINRQQGAQDEIASKILVTQKQLGGLPGIVVPYFPANSILVTMPSNLSIYYQKGARRRQVIDEPKRDRIANYESSNDAYVIEDNGAAAMVENIVIGKWN